MTWIQEWLVCGGDYTWDVQSLIFQGENLRYGLNWLCGIVLVQSIVLRVRTFWGWKPNIYDRAVAVVVHCFLLQGVGYGEYTILVLSWWCQCCYFKKWNSLAGLFFCIFSFFWLCASFVPVGHDVVIEAMCNWHLRGINICSLPSKNMIVSRTLIKILGRLLLVTLQKW
jgi:hypothetical protein